MNCAFCEQSYWFICNTCIEIYNSTPQGRDILRLTIYMFLKETLTRLNAVINSSHRVNLTSLTHLESYTYQKFIKNIEGLWVVLEPISTNRFTTIRIPFTHWTSDLSIISSDLSKLRKLLLICFQKYPHLLVTSTDIANHVMDHCISTVQCFNNYIHSPMIPRYDIFIDAQKLGINTIITSFTEESQNCRWQETIGPIKIPINLFNF